MFLPVALHYDNYFVNYELSTVFFQLLFLFPLYIVYLFKSAFVQFDVVVRMYVQACIANLSLDFDMLIIIMLIMYCTDGVAFSRF
jgi:hypothetical protein